MVFAENGNARCPQGGESRNQSFSLPARCCDSTTKDDDEDEHEKNVRRDWEIRMLFGHEAVAHTADGIEMFCGGA